MRRSTVLWICAFLVTAGAAFWQEISGPTFPIRTRVTLGGQHYPVTLTRSWSDGDQPIDLAIADPAVRGRVRWRRYPSDDTWTVHPLERTADVLHASLPHQPPAGKLEYQLELGGPGERVLLPQRPAVTRFKGAVSPAILVPHIAAMFLGMLFSARAGFEALFNGPRRGPLTAIATGLLLVGGFVLGPLVQKAAFGAYWTGVPWGYDLTDNKTLIAVAAWLVAAWRLWRPGAANTAPARWSIVCAALVTAAVFAIPHSTWGSEIKWD